jgi:tRNA G18 (ribose-2'-O)-methylase SpoU
VGGVFRNAAAFGADAVLLDPKTCDPLYRKAIRTSAGASLTIPFARLQPWPEALERLREAGFILLAMTPHGGAMPLDEFARQQEPARLALLFGSEGDGLTAGAQGYADHRIRIRMAPGADSLNVAVAAGIALSRLSPFGPPG